jgi:hypothetical protein
VCKCPLPTDFVNSKSVGRKAVWVRLPLSGTNLRKARDHWSNGATWFGLILADSLPSDRHAALQLFKPVQHNSSATHGRAAFCLPPTWPYLLSAGFTYPCWRTFFRSGRMLRYVI